MVERTILEASLKKTRLDNVWTMHVRNETAGGTHVVFPIPFSSNELEHIKSKLGADGIEKIAEKLRGGSLRIISGNHALISRNGTEIGIEDNKMKAASDFAFREPSKPFENFQEEKQFRKKNPLKRAGSWAMAHEQADETIRDIIERINSSEFAYTSSWSHSLLEKRQENQVTTASDRLEKRRKQKKGGESNPWDPRLIHWPHAAFPMQQAYLTFRADSDDPKTKKLLDAFKRANIRTEAIPASQATYRDQPNFLIRFRAGHKDITQRNKIVETFWNKVRKALSEAEI